MPTSSSYVLVTAAHNEEAVIEQTILSVVRQSQRPELWVIVSDASTDRTDDIAADYARQYPFIRHVRVDRPAGRNFASKVKAVRLGFDIARQHAYAYIGNLDADISFEATYFARLLERFEADAQLGIGGGWIYEESGGQFRPRRLNSVASVPHAVHLLRRRCYEDIGDYVPLPHGGEDTCAVVMARMCGWKTEAFADLPVRHYGRRVSSLHALRNSTRRGRLDYSLGYAPLYELLACGRRLASPPYVAGAILQLMGFCVSSVLREPRLVSKQFVSFLRAEQRHRLASHFQILRRPT